MPPCYKLVPRILPSHGLTSDQGATFVTFSASLMGQEEKGARREK